MCHPTEHRTVAVIGKRNVNGTRLLCWPVQIMKCGYSDRPWEQTHPDGSRRAVNPPDEKVHWEVPRETTERCLLLAACSDGVIDLRNVRGDMRHSRVIKPIDPYSRVSFNYFSIQVMKCPCHVLKRSKLMRKLCQFLHPYPHPRLTRMNQSDKTRNEVVVEQQQAPSHTAGGRVCGHDHVRKRLALPNKGNMHIPFSSTPE